MVLKINNLVILIFLIFLQSCSGGRIGNFLESSFQNIEETRRKENTRNIINNKKEFNSEEKAEKNKDIEETRRKENTRNIINNKKEFNSEEKAEKNKDIEETRRKENTRNIINNKKEFNSEEKSKNNKKITLENKLLKKRKYQPQSYKIIFILKDVDPKDPIEDLSIILRNSDVNFEIEKIERFFDENNKTIENN